MRVYLPSKRRNRCSSCNAPSFLFNITRPCPWWRSDRSGSPDTRESTPIRSSRRNIAAALQFSSSRNADSPRTLMPNRTSRVFARNSLAMPSKSRVQILLWPTMASTLGCRPIVPFLEPVPHEALACVTCWAGVAYALRNITWRYWFPAPPALSLSRSSRSGQTSTSGIGHGRLCPLNR
ncbi:hypothetical protein BSY18_4172 (plasmid) [Blastomonas sp. RAC04]|nr:hypothetical protein BSY18_4172 [Blastomonas sp. RAC04]